MGTLPSCSGAVQVVFAALWGILFFDEIPDGWTATGALVILTSALLVRDEFDALTLATHDREFAIAARAEGFRVHGAPTGD